MRRFLNKVFGGDGDQARTKAGGRPRRSKPTQRPPLGLEFLEERTLLSTNLSIGKPVTGSGSYAEHVSFKHVTDGKFDDMLLDPASGDSYWLTPIRDCNSSKVDNFIVDLQGQPLIEGFELQNTHNYIYNNGGTKDFRIWLSSDGVNYHQVVQNQLPKAVDPIPKQLFNISPEKARYVKFEVLSCYGIVGGLNEITVYGQTEGTPPTTAAPAAPSGLVARPGTGSQIELSWNPSAGATAYSVQQWNGVTRQWQQIAQVPAGTTQYTVKNLQPGTTYYFSVGAINSAAPNGIYSPLASANTPPLTASPAPSGTQVDLCWVDVAGEIRFDIYKKSNGGGWQFVITVQANVTCQSVQGLSPGTTYTFAVGAFNSTGSFFHWDQQTATTPKAVAPKAPANLVATATSSAQIKLNWSDVAGNDGYSIWWWDDNLRKYTRIDKGEFGADATVCFVNFSKPLKPGTTLRFAVGAYNSAGANFSYVNVTT